MLGFPSDWCKQENILETIDKEIEQIENVIKSLKPYDSLRRIVNEASGGLALRGVYYSKYAPPITADIPILLPPDEVESKNPVGPFEERFLKFTKEETAQTFAQKAESSGFNAAIGIVGSSDLIDGEIGVAGGYEKLIDHSLNTKTSTSSVSVTKMTRIGLKAFQIRQTNMRLPVDARMMALSIVDENDNEKQKNVARKFFERYGSHVCGGVHNLGGMFFYIAAAHSNEETSTSSLIEAVKKRLDTKLHANFLGAGLGGQGIAMVEESYTEKTANQEKELNFNVAYSIKSIGPNAKNPVTFGKLLSTNNATWAVLDRGETCSYIPVWELLESNEYKKSASVMEQTWKEEEEKKKKEFEENIKKKEKTFMKEESKEELEQLKITYLQEFQKFCHCHSPNVGNDYLITFKRDKMTKNQAFTKAVELISEDPEVIICEISSKFHLLREDYSLKCWRASRDQAMTYGSKEGKHVLFYSKKYYLWQKGIFN